MNKGRLTEAETMAMVMGITHPTYSLPAKKELRPRQLIAASSIEDVVKTNATQIKLDTKLLGDKWQAIL